MLPAFRAPVRGVQSPPVGIVWDEAAVTHHRLA